jgi:hypothetical protein
MAVVVFFHDRLLRFIFSAASCFFGLAENIERSAAAFKPAIQDHVSRNSRI